MFSSHRTRCLLYYLWEINNGIHIYQFTYELVVVPDLNKIIGGSTDLYRLSYGFEFNLELICTKRLVQFQLFECKLISN